MTQGFVMVFPSGHLGKTMIQSCENAYGLRTGIFRLLLREGEREHYANNQVACFQFRDNELVRDGWNPTLTAGWEEWGYGDSDVLIDLTLPYLTDHMMVMNKLLCDLMAGRRGAASCKAIKLPLNAIYSKPLPLP